MRLFVHVLEATGLPVKDSYAKINVGKFKSKTWVSKGTPNPAWNEEFVFRAHDLDDEVVVSVFATSGVLVGRVRIPVSSISTEDNRTLPPTWFSLERQKAAGKFSNKGTGKILLTFSLHGEFNGDQLSSYPNDAKSGQTDVTESTKSSTHKVHTGKPKLVKSITKGLERIFSKLSNDVKSSDDSSELPVTPSENEESVGESPRSYSFEEGIEMMESQDSGRDMPQNLEGGVLLDQVFIVGPSELNKHLFAPHSEFRTNLAKIQGTTDVVEGPWVWKSGDMACLTRTSSYTKAATKLVKAVKATEQETYMKADGQNFAVMVSVSTPEVPYGSIFQVELLYKIMPGQEQDSVEEETSHLVISWRVNFHKSSMMKSMIEGGVRQGLTESFETFANLLGENFKMMDPAESLEKDQVIASLGHEHQSDLQLGLQYFWNFTIITTILIFLYTVVHVLMCKRGGRGLEFSGLDLPDSFGEIFACGILTIQLERVYYMVLHFVQARLQQGSDHGLKAQGEGWVLTVALIEATDLASVDSTEGSDPYVVFTCNGRTRTSSVKLQSCNPQWNEVIEFEAMEDPPSVLDVEIFDFDGPFDQSTSLGHAEINFLQHSSTELADMWVFLDGKLARSAQSKLHLRIFLDNTNGVETVKEYLTKMEKEVGKKLNLRSPHTNSAFQKLFGLPPEEFLISAFTCSLKRKLPLQGRLFLSARIIGFYANLFGHKTRFFFLWEDIEDIQILPPSFSSVGSPSLMIVLHKGRGLDARHAAKFQDREGRLKFYFQSFVSFNVASRTIMGVWRTRTLAPAGQKVEVAEEQLGQEKYALLDEYGVLFDGEDVKTTKIFSSELPISISSLMELFSGGKLEKRVMERSGCLGYTMTSWECTKPNIFERSLSYKFSRHASMFGGEVSSTQQKSLSDEGWTVNEVMAVHNVPFSDHFRVIFRYRILKPNLGSESNCKCEVEMGMMWLKSSKFQDRISSNITDKFGDRVREMFELVEREILLERNSNRRATST